MLTALKVRGIGDSGAYASVGMKVLERAAGHACGPYRWPSLDIETIAVRTNNLVCGAFRGFGANQAQFAMEGVLDRLAEQVGISGWEIRKRNVIRPGEEWGPGQIMDDGAGGAEACLDQIKASYDAAIAAGKAVGLGLGLKNSGLGNGFREVSKAVVRFLPAVGDAPGRIEVRHGWTEMGQGVHTVALQVAAQELGVDPNRIDVIVDTTRELGFGQTTGSRGTLMVAGSVSDAAAAALAGGCALDVDYEGEYVVDWTQKLGDPSVTNPTIHAVFSFAAQMVIADPETGRDREGRRRPRRRQGGQPDRSSRARSRAAVHMGLGYALTEEFPTDPETGFPTNMTLRSLGILRAKDVPEIEVQLVEVPQPAFAVRHQGRRRDRPRAHRARGRRRAPRRRRRVAHHPAHAPRHPLTPPASPFAWHFWVGRVIRICNANGGWGASGGGGVAEEVAGAGAASGGDVVGVVQRARVEAEAAAADAPVELLLHRFEQGDALVENRLPRRGELRPLAAVRRATRGSESSAALISPRLSPTRWATLMNPTRRITSAAYRRWPASVRSLTIRPLAS